MSAWRARASEAAPPASVAAVVQSVRSTLRWTRACESALLGVAAVLLTRAAALASGLEGALLSETWPLASLCGALCAAAWWREHPHGARATARALDERLRHHGALVTAFELETRRAASPMAELVTRRVLERLRKGEALRSLVPPLFVPVAAPSLAALVLVLASDARRPTPAPEVDYLALAEGLQRALALGALDEDVAGMPGEDDDGGLSREQVQAIRDVLDARGALPFSRDGWQADPAALRQTLAQLDRRMAELADGLEPASELGTRLERARPWLEALRMGLGPAGAEASGAGPGGEGLTGGDVDGTISGSPPSAATSPIPPEPMADPVRPVDGGPPALGLQAGNWWPSEYDAVVARWLERVEASAQR